MTAVIQKDIIIIGGGIAGLWLLQRLRQQGYDAVLFEQEALGSGQTVASQGMIHGGIKYALSGSLSRASETIADMPELWKRCISGHGDVDLRGCKVLSQRYYMWPRESVRSRLTAFLGSKALRGRVNAIAQDQYPSFFRGHIPGPLYQLSDIVLDVPALLHTLSAPLKEHIFKIDWESAELQLGDNQEIAGLQLQSEGESFHFQAQRYIVTSGAGTPSLLAQQHLQGPEMQRRPLHMVLVKHQIKEPVYVHCVANQLNSTPEVTVTTHLCEDGKTAWYLGGELAEAGVNLEQKDQIDAARARVNTLFHWCNLDNARWSSFFIDRAEPRQSGGKRPDNFFIKNIANYQVCWPTKLTLAPALANTILRNLQDEGIMPLGNEQPPPALPFPGIARPPWETCF